MFKCLLSNKGSTLLLVLSVIIVVSLLMLPLVMNLNIGFLQTQTDAKYEQASSESESAVRVIRKLLSVANGYNKNDLTALVNDIEERFPNTNIVLSLDPITGNPTNIEVTSEIGKGTVSRNKVTNLPILLFSDRASDPVQPGPAQGSTGTEFYHSNAVVVSNPAYNSFFHVCGAPDDIEQPADTFYENRVDDQQPLNDKFQTEFSNFITYYTGTNFNTRMSARPAVLAASAMPAAMADISTTIVQTPYTFTAANANATGIKRTGHVSIVSTSNWINISALSSGNAIEANGNLTFPDYISGSNTILNGNIKVGGNFTTTGMEGLTINGDVYVKGNVSFGGINNLTINGSLYVNGSLTFTGSVANLKVTGSIITGGNIQFQNSATNIEIRSTMSSIGSIQFNGYVNSLKVGSWTPANLINNNDISNLVAGTTLSFNGVNTLRVSGSMSSNIFTANSQIQTMILGGSFITNSGATFPSSMVGWQIVGSISVGGLLQAGSMQTLTVGQSIYAGSGISFADISTKLTVGGSLLSSGSITFTNSIALVEIGGDVISKNNITFQSIQTLNISGTVAATGNVLFTNTIATVTVGNDLLASGNMSFESINTKFNVGGILGASNNVSFNNNIANSNNSLGGFYAGGTTKFPNWYTNGTGNNSICIEYSSPNTGTDTGIEFGI